MIDPFLIVHLHLSSSGGDFSGIPLVQVLSVDNATASSSAITYEARDLMWLDGFDAVREVLSPLQVSDQLQPSLPLEQTCTSSKEMQWCCNWKGSQADLQESFHPHVVQQQELLLHMGVPQQQLQSISQKVGLDNIAALQQIVLPSFMQTAANLMASQLPDMQLMQKQSSFFSG